MKRIAMLLWGLSLGCFVYANTPIKNVIIMIPDGCSTDLLAIGRWVQNGIPLALDQRICGLVRTHCSDSPIGDSAPAGSTYACGHRSKAAYVGTFPDTTMSVDGTRIEVDSNQAFRPMFSLMEAAHLQGMRTALVFTCFFADATPASFLAHTPRRKEYFRIAKQMVHQPCDVLLGGGSYYVDSAQVRFGFDAPSLLAQKGIFYTHDFAQCQKKIQEGFSRIWGLFAPKEMAYEIDRNSTQEPSLDQMTRAALSMLAPSSASADTTPGFFMMVEGSKIDWGEHDHDVPATVYDFLAFDKAVQAVLEFAEKDQQTLVIILPDHQTGGLKLGNSLSNGRYARIPIQELIDPIKQYKCSYARSIELLGKEASAEQIREITQKNYQIELSQAQVDTVEACLKQYGPSRRTVRTYAQVVNAHQYVGFTTYGHTGGDAFLAMYHPQGKVLSGVVENERIAPYIVEQLQWSPNQSLDSLSCRYYVKPTEIRHWDQDKTVYPKEESLDTTPSRHRPAAPYVAGKIASGTEPLYRELCSGKDIYRLYPNTDYIEKNGKKVFLNTLVVFNGLDFYLPAACLKAF